MTRRTLLALGAAGALPLRPATTGRVVKKRGMIVRSARPEDLEMPLEGFRDFITPADRFFVRSHHYVPAVDAASWRLAVEGEVRSPVSLRLDELKRMPRAELTACWNAPETVGDSLIRPCPAFSGSMVPSGMPAGRVSA